FFFFQAEDGIRDFHVTGVQTCALPIWSLRAGYLVACDGGRSQIRKAAGIEFPGWDPTTSWLIAEVEMAEEPQWGIRQHGTGGIRSEERRVGKECRGRGGGGEGRGGKTE